MMKKTGLRWAGAVCLCVLLTVEAAAVPKRLVPGGHTIGIKLYTQGLLVTGFEEESAAEEAGLRKGDRIIQVDGRTVHTAEDMRSCVSDEPVVVTVLRCGKEAEFCVTPEQNRLGAYVRDALSGIGTVTYYDPETGAFGALGHGVNDVDTALLMPVEAGVAVNSTVESVRKGRSGEPGELKGHFDVSRILGEVTRNTDHGIFGTMTGPVEGTALELADPAQVKPGKAYVLCNVWGSRVCSYEAEILKVNREAGESGRDLLLQVTDPKLLDLTGGIVQGMSGSPIIQNGKLVGAVTHVLVNDPTRGYGIFIKNMLDAAGQ